MPGMAGPSSQDGGPSRYKKWLKTPDRHSIKKQDAIRNSEIRERVGGTPGTGEEISLQPMEWIGIS